MNEKREHQLNVVIGGQALTLSSDISEKHMEEVSKFVDKKYQNIKLNKRVSTNLLFGIFLGIEIADEYFIERNRLLDEIDLLNAEHEQEILNYKKQEKAKETELLKYIEKANELDEEKDDILEKYNKLNEEFYELRDENIALLDELTLLQSQMKAKEVIEDESNTFKITEIEQELEQEVEQEIEEKLEQEVEQEIEQVEETEMIENAEENHDLEEIDVIEEIEEIEELEKLDGIEKIEEVIEVEKLDENNDVKEDIIQSGQPLSKKEYRKMMRKKGKK